jgi:hypothetical protein
MLIKLAFITIVVVILGLPIYVIFKKLWESGKEEEATARLHKELTDKAHEEIESEDIERKLSKLRSIQKPLGNHSQQKERE